jgi:hypothetical protein
MNLTHERSKPALRDLLADDTLVVVIQGFQPFMGQLVERGRYYRLNDPIVRRHPQFFAICIPVTDVLVGEIES